MLTLLDTLLAALANAFRFGTGYRVGVPRVTPQQLPVLYEYEACPFCRKVREAIGFLGLIVRVIPCPKGATKHREQVKATGGRQQFPFLIDPNHQLAMYESEAIIKHLITQYGKGSRPWLHRIPVINELTNTLCSLFRIHRGNFARSTSSHGNPDLTVYGYEASPSCRLVRETLCERQISYTWTPAKSFKTDEGDIPVPVLVDHRQQQTISGVTGIKRHLKSIYS